MKKYYQCPYDKATTCIMEDGCKGCEDFHPEKLQPLTITALFESILVEHIAASELRDLYRHKLMEIIG